MLCRRDSNAKTATERIGSHGHDADDGVGGCSQRFILNTSDSSITSTSRTSLDLSSNALDIFTNPTVAAARMFDLDHDVAVSALQSAGDSVLVMDIDPGILGTGRFNLGSSAKSLFSAVGDFTGDGYDDLVFANDSGSLGVFTAVDPAVPSQGYGLDLLPNWKTSPMA
jgi:hypothetical protein